MNDGACQQLAPRNEALPTEASSTKIALGTLQHLDTAGLSPQRAEHLRMKHAEGMIALNHKAQDLQIEVGAMSATLGTMATNVKDVTEAGGAVTLTHVHKTSLGQTEVIMGNTEAATKGKISRAARGDADKTLWYVLLAAVVVVVIVLASVGSAHRTGRIAR